MTKSRHLRQLRGGASWRLLLLVLAVCLWAAHGGMQAAAQHSAEPQQEDVCSGPYVELTIHGLGEGDKVVYAVGGLAAFGTAPPQKAPQTSLPAPLEVAQPQDACSRLKPKPAAGAFDACAGPHAP
jgi:hypothetical protein